MGISSNFWKKLKTYIKPQYYAASLSAVLAGFIAHMPVFTKNLPVYDTFWNIYFNQDMITSGRQFLTFAAGPTSYYNLPWVNGVVSLVFLALTAVLFTELFRIEKKSTAVLLGAMIATFPAVCGTFAFIYTADGYMLAFFLATLAVLFADRMKLGFIPGIFLLGFSIGVYQAYFSVSILLMIFVLVKDLMKEDAKWKPFFLKCARFLGTVVGGYLFYVLSLKVMLALSHRALSGYQGSDKVGGFPLGSLPVGLKSAFLDFKNFTFSGGIFTENIWMKIAYVAFAAISLGVFVFLLIKNKAYKNIPKIFVILLLLAAVPFAASLICIISPDVLFHILMRMPWAVIFAFGLSLCDQLAYFGCGTKGDSRERDAERKDTKGSLKYITSAVGLLSAGILVFNFVLAANVVYFNLNERYEKTYGLCLRIADRLEQTEGYKTGDQVAILGGFPNQEIYPSTDITEKITRGYHETEGDYCIESSEKYAEFMKHYLNVSIVPADFEKQLEVADTEEFRNMDYFPYDGCIEKINGVWVVKLNG